MTLSLAGTLTLSNICTVCAHEFYSVTLVPPTSLLYDGASKECTLDFDPHSFTCDLVYKNTASGLDDTPRLPGSYTATLTVDGRSVTHTYTVGYTVTVYPQNGEDTRTFTHYGAFDPAAYVATPAFTPTTGHHFAGYALTEGGELLNAPLTPEGNLTLYVRYAPHDSATPATCTSAAICGVCNEAHGTPLADAHVYTDAADADCNLCGASRASDAASGGNGGTGGTADNNTPNGNEGSDSDAEGKRLGAGAITGIVLGGGAVLGGGIFVLYWFAIKKKSFADLVAIFKK